MVLYTFKGYLTEKVKILHLKYEQRSCDHTSQLYVLDVVAKSFYDQLHQPVLGTADVWNYPLPTSKKHEYNLKHSFEWNFTRIHCHGV